MTHPPGAAPKPQGGGPAPAATAVQQYALHTDGGWKNCTSPAEYQVRLRIQRLILINLFSLNHPGHLCHTTVCFQEFAYADSSMLHSVTVDSRYKRL